MTDKIKDLFDDIRAEDSLKMSTKLFIKERIKNNKVRKTSFPMTAFAAVTASFIIIFAVVCRFYFTPSFYLDLEVNPSIELIINPFEKVIGVASYNEDGESIIRKIDLRHKNYSEAIKLLMADFDKSGYIKDDGLISVTFQTENNAEKLAVNIKESVTDIIEEKYQDISLEVFPVTKEIRKSAHECMVSPAKLIAINELMEINPTVTIAECSRHSISAIKEMSNNYKIKHHQNNDTADISETENDERDEIKSDPPYETKNYAPDEITGETNIITEKERIRSRQQRHGNHHY